MQNIEESPISRSLLSDFMENFYGYGNLNAPYWFIGKEEGGGKDLEENFQRILTWEKMGKSITVDSIRYHYQLGFTKHQLTRIQPTWTKLIQILLTLEDDDAVNIEKRREFQFNRLGNAQDNNCCLELMPMASRSTGLWLWKDIFQNYFGFKDRKTYFDNIVPNRRNKLSQLIANYKPKMVLFYSSQINYIIEWNNISDVDEWEWVTLSKYFKYGWSFKNGTLYIVTPHPTTHGIKLDDFPKVGSFIKNKLT